MQKRLWGAVICCLAMLVFANVQGDERGDGEHVGKIVGTASTEHPQWFKESFLEIDEDVAEAAASGKHVLLYFYINDCPYCHKMVEENFKSSSYTEFLQAQFDVIALNVYGDREVAFDENTTVPEKVLAKQLKVRYTPTILFLDHRNQPVLRLNGYRSVQAFKHALDFVNEKAYTRTSLSRYIEEKEQRTLYVFRDHEQLVDITELDSVAEKPLAVLFEDRTCDECDALHESILNLPQTKAILQKFTFVRLDAFSQHPITDVAGNSTTPKDYAEALGLTYRPGIVLFDRGQEITRIDGMLKTYYFQEILRYVGERHYGQYPQLRDYLAARTESVLNSGQDIDIWQ